MGQPALVRDEYPGMTREEHPRALVDANIAVRLLKEALRRIAGVPPGSSFLTTMFVLGVLATALRRVAAPAVRVFRPRHLTVAGAAMVIAVLAAALRSVGGVRAKPSTGAAIAVSELAPLLHSIEAAAQRVRAALGRFRVAFGNRYGG